MSFRWLRYDGAQKRAVMNRHDKPLVRARRVAIVMASAVSLPFADAAFDKTLCAHVLYF